MFVLDTGTPFSLLLAVTLRVNRTSRKGPQKKVAVHDHTHRDSFAGDRGRLSNAENGERLAKTPNVGCARASQGPEPVPPSHNRLNQSLRSLDRIPTEQEA